MSQRELHGKKHWEWKKFILQCSSFLKKYPFLHSFIKKSCSTFNTFRINRKLKSRFKKCSIDFSFDKIYWINTEQIIYATLHEFLPLEFSGSILDGDWDKLEKKFENLEVFIAFKERFLEKKEWHQTTYYKIILKGIEQGRYLWNCTNKYDLDKRFQFIDTLYKKIKKNGYKSQREIHFRKKYNIAEILDEISINIGRNGDVLFNDGAHRLSIVKILEIEKIPIHITVIHKELLDKIKQNEITLDQILS